MGLSDIDRKLLERCLDRQPGAWEDFVDRFLGLVVHVIHHTSQSRSVRPSQADIDELAGEVFLTIVQDDFATLRNFRGESSLATYLTVVAPRRRPRTAQTPRRSPVSRMSVIARNKSTVTCRSKSVSATTTKSNDCSTN